MFSPDGRLYHLLDTFSRFLLLNFLWLLSCLPIITIFPATAAMFGLVRKWQQEKDYGLFRAYFSLLWENAKQGLLVGFVWSCLGALLLFNLYLSFQMPPLMKLLMLAIIVLVGFLYLCTTIFLFPVMVHFRTKGLSVLKHAFLLAISQPAVTLGSLLLVGFTAAAISFMPIALFVLSSVTAYLIYFLCQKSFKRLAREEKRAA